MREENLVCVCLHCLTPSASKDACRYCGGTKITCFVGEADDPIRRPLMDGSGHVLTRAPIWWLMATIPELIEGEG